MHSQGEDTREEGRKDEEAGKEKLEVEGGGREAGGGMKQTEGRE